MRIKDSILLLLFLMCSFIFSDTLTVGVSTYEPMVYTDNQGNLIGFDIEFFSKVAEEANLIIKYKQLPLFQDLLEKVELKEIDFAISGISITEEREKRIDFSHPYFRSGLSILIPNDANSSRYNWLKDQIKLYASIILRISPLVLLYALYVLCAGLLIYLWENWGKFDCIYFVNTVISSTGFGDLTPKTKKGKIVAQVLMFSGIGFIFPLLTGTVTSELTAAKLISAINSPEDLKGRKVCVTEGTTSVEAAKEYGAQVVLVKDEFEAVEHLSNGKADAFIYDFPGVSTLAKKNSNLKAVNVTFKKQDYGVAMQQNSPYREKINLAILKRIKKDHDEIYKKYISQEKAH